MSRKYWASSPHEGDFVVHSSGPWKKHKYLKKIGDGANAVYQYATNYATGVKNANRDYQRAKDAQANAQAFSKLAREEAPGAIKASKRREKAAMAAYNRTKDHSYLKRASEEQQRQASVSRGVYNSARAADEATKRVANSKAYRKRVVNKPARDLLNLIRPKKKKKSSKKVNWTKKNFKTKYFNNGKTNFKFGTAKKSNKKIDWTKKNLKFGNSRK